MIRTFYSYHKKDNEIDLICGYKGLYVILPNYFYSNFKFKKYIFDYFYFSHYYNDFATDFLLHLNSKTN